LFSSGCSIIHPENIGISRFEWNHYSKEKRISLKYHYNAISKDIDSKCSSITADAIESNCLKVKFTDGSVLYPPFFLNWQKYIPVDFVICNGQCKKLVISHMKLRDLQTKLTVCFIDHILYLDPNYRDLNNKYGSLRLYYTPLWITGLTYDKICSQGIVRLNNVSISVQKFIK